MSEEWIDSAARILSRRFGGTVRLEPGEDAGLSGRAHVHRAQIAGGPNEAPPTVIVKQPQQSRTRLYDPDDTNSTAFQFFNEWASLQFLTEVGGESPVAPRFLGGERDRGVIVMEDFGAGTRLDHDLLGDSAAAAGTTIKGLMVTLGRMHAQTIGKTQRYMAIRRDLGPIRDDELIETMHGIRRNVAFRDKLDQVRVTVARGFFTEYDEMRARWNNSGVFRALVHSDPCPDNCHWIAGEVRLLDFEHARIAPACMDGAYARAPFPSCWCVGRLPDNVWRSAEDAYRDALTIGCPEAGDDALFRQAMLDACVRWNLATGFGWHLPGALEKDRRWGEATVRQRIVYRFERLAETCDEFGLMPATAETARRLAKRFRALWPGLPELALYPAFRG